MKTPLLLFAVAIGLATLVSCKPDDRSTDGARAAKATGTAVPPAPRTNPVDATGMIEPSRAANSPNQTALADTKALAGRFSDGASVLELNADGTYVQTLQVAGSALTASGTWSAIGPAALLLDPGSKSAEDAVFFVATNDELNSENGTLTFRRISPP